MLERFTIERCAWLVAVATGLSCGFAQAQTSTYSIAGVYTSVVPAGATIMIVKLWGAGGGNGTEASGGGGAFAKSIFAVSPGQSYVVVVGQQGAYEDTNLGGAGSGNTEGGAPGFLGDYNERGQGGQGSSVFRLTNGLLVTKAIAGAGGGAGRNGDGGAGGQPGSTTSGAIPGAPGSGGLGGAGGGGGSTGSIYSSAAISTGIVSLSLAGGGGGNAADWSGGGGGGFGGGGGGGGGSGGDGAGGGGGGSLGDFFIAGNGSQPGNMSDVNYVPGRANAAQDGIVVVIYSSNDVPPVANTGGATNIGLRSAHIYGTVNPGNASTAAWFEYGTSTLYGTTSATSLLSPALSNLAVTAPVLNLSPGTLYHFRLVASNAYGVANGDDLTFHPMYLTNAFDSSGIYTQVVPIGIGQMIVKLWGAGGGGGQGGGSGGGGAFSSVALDVVPGDTFVMVVGQGGQAYGAGLGGVNNGITQGGPPGYQGDYNGRAQGGQASSLFKHLGGLFYMRAVAGAGGGAGIGAHGGAGGQAGANGGGGATGGNAGGNGAGGSGGSGAFPGGDYFIAAITNGIAALNLANGNGGAGGTYSGGGGGGYGGGGGGGIQVSTGSGGGGGGSYGSTTFAGSGPVPGNSGDSDYNGNSGAGFTGNSSGNDGLIVVLLIPASPESPPVIDSATKFSGGSIRLTFTNTPDLTFTALAATDLLAPANDWNLLGPAFETAPGKFEFSDPQSSDPARFYKIRSP